MTNLVEINSSFNLTNKELHHYYLHIYDFLFFKYKNRKVDILEVGVRRGGSILLWDKYFNQSGTKIYGVDVKPKMMKKEYYDKFSKRVNIISDDINNIIRNDGFKDKKFDILIDDASHQIIDQMIFFKYFKDKVNDGGILIIEDFDCKNNINDLLNMDKKLFYIDIRNVKKGITDYGDSVLIVYINS